MTAVDVQLVQGLAQRVTAVRPDLVNGNAYGLTAAAIASTVHRFAPR